MSDLTPESTPTRASKPRGSRRARLLVGAAVAAAVALPVAAGAVPGFDDVPDDHPHNDGIQWLVDNGITQGCDADSYCPSDFVTRAQMGSFFHRLSGHAPGVAPSVDADTVDGLHASELGGISNVNVVESQVTIASADDFETVTTTCGAGEIAIGGGHTLLNGPNAGASLAQSEWFVVANQPTVAGDGWVVSVRHEDGGGPAADRALRVHAVCATP